MVIHRKEEISDSDLDKPQQTCEISGSLQIGTFPKWRQKGEDELIRMRDRYLCVKINEANVFDDISDGGEPRVWIDVTWGGVTKRTRDFRRANVN